MNISPKSQRRGREERGIALVIVLAMLVLLSGLLIAFFSSATSERAASRTAASGFDARQAADSTVNFVISQIREATSDAEPDTTWASQPGAVWKFNLADPTKPKAVFKLYSADETQVKKNSGLTEAFAADVGSSVPGSILPGFVDLNERVFVKSGTQYIAQFPIVDPSARLTALGGEPVAFESLEMDTADNKRPLVEGFDCWNLTDKDPTGTKTPILPMPVKWMYILKDGTMGTMSTLISSSGSAPSKKNPIVARTAFWTDDEASKVNINTAAEGTYWDTPSYVSFRESGNVNGAGDITDAGGSITTDLDIYGGASLNLAVAQPVRGEFQRYPGHPATTCLSPILKGFWPPIKKTSTESELSFRELLSGMLPYITFPKTSKAGTSIPFWRTGSSGAATGVAVNDADRLYASVDELMFRPNRSSRNESGPSSSEAVDTPQTDFTPSKLEKVRFFLTANSRASDLNLFGTPRVTIWPTADLSDPTKRTPFDELFNYCSTVGGKRFAFTRSNSFSSTTDYSGSARNQQVFRYLKDLTGDVKTSIPGFGSGTFLAKYGVSPADPDGISDRDQILAEIYDYIRCTNVVDGSYQELSQPPFQSFTNHYWPPQPGAPAGINNQGRPQTGAGQVVPIKIPSGDGSKFAQGFGRYATISEVAVLFAATSSAAANITPPETLPALPAGSRRMRAYVILEMNTPAMGYPSLKEDYQVTLTASDDPFKIIRNPGKVGASQEIVEFFSRADSSAPTSAQNAASATNTVEVDALSSGGRGMMPSRGIANGFMYFNPLRATKALCSKLLDFHPRTRPYQQFVFTL